MKRKVRITKSPNNSNAEPFSQKLHHEFPGAEDLAVRTSLPPVDKDVANVEAEKGEVVVSNYMNDGIPELYVVGGKPHSKGGTPLNLPNNSFVFSKDKSLSISDQNILKMFGKSGKGKNKYTPAELAKQYKINDYRKVLADPSSDDLQRTTAEKMIQNYVNKLGALSMAQESMKGFPDGIPAVAMGYLSNSGIDPSQLVTPPQMAQVDQQSQMKYGGQTNSLTKKYSSMKMKKGGVHLRDGERVRLNKNSGEYEIVNVNNEVIGRINNSKRKGNLEEMQEGGTPDISGKTTKYQNIPEDAVKWDESTEGYDETKVQPGDYIKKADGSWYQVTGYKTSPYTYDYQDPRLVGSGGDLQEAYGRLEQMVLDPKNTEFRKDLVKKYRENLRNTDPNSKTGLTQEDIDKALSLSDEEIIQNFLGMEQQIFAVNASGIGGKGMDPEDSWDKDRANYVDTVTQLGFDPYNTWQQAAFQSAYIALNDLSTDENYKDFLGDFRMAQEGRDDENLSGLRTGSISQIDGWVGNTTIGQAAIYKPTLKELEIDEVDWQDAPEAQETPVLDVGPEAAPNAPWWLQDIVKTSGAASDMVRIKKHTPWQATPGTYLPESTFYDPTRELAAIGEQANIGQEAAAMFSGPQALGARTTAIQGQAAANIADSLGRYNDMNVQVANQAEAQKAQLLNQAAINRSNLATQLYDKNTIANQQFDNAKAMTRQNMRQSYIDAITNRGQTQALNELYPQYNVDPMSGGFLEFTKGRDVTPSNSSQKGVIDLFHEYKNQNPGVSDDILYKMAANDMGINSAGGNHNEMDPAYFANYANMLP